MIGVEREVRADLTKAIKSFKRVGSRGIDG